MKKFYILSILKNVLILICLTLTITANAQTSKVQFINNSPDPAMDSVDIYINGVLTIPGLGFRKATPYIVIYDSVPCAIAIAPKHSIDISQAVFNSTETLIAGKGYYKVISGLINPANFPRNPDTIANISTTFTVYTFTGARDTSYVVVNGVHQNVDLLYHHGSPDLMKTTMQSNNTSMFISKNDAYGAFHLPYSYQAPFDLQEFDLNDAAMDTTLIKNAVGNLNKKVGKAGLIFCSGFYTNLKLSLNPANQLTESQKNRILGLFIAWPDGSIDTIQAIPIIKTGVNDLSFDTKYHTAFYPNPTSDMLNISFELKSQSSVTTQLFDINGRMVSSTNETLKLSGKNQLELDVKNVVNGIYFCSLTIDGQKIVRKISVLK